MDQRPRIFFCFIFCLVVKATADTTVESTPVDVFIDRSGLWHSQKISSSSVHGENLSPYESLNKVPGVQSRLEGSPTLSIRGSQSLPRVLGLYNGIPLNSADGFGPNRMLIPQETIADIKIFKGPASVFFGSDAIGGAINFLSRRYTGPTLRGSIGSYGQKSILGALPISSTPDSYSHLTSFSEGYDGGNPFTLSSSGQDGMRSSTNRALQRHTFFGEQKLGRLSFSENLIWAQEIATTPGSVKSPETTHARNSSGLASLSTIYDFNSDLSLSHRIYGIKGANEYRDSRGQTFADTVTVGNSLSARKRWSSVASSEFFGDYKYDDFKSTYSGNQYYTANEAELGSVLDYNISENMILKPGTRYLFNYKSFVNALGVFEEYPGLKRWLTYSEGFHAPSLIQRYSTDSSSLANPDLKPETSSQVEIGFEQNYMWNETTPWNKLSLGFSAYTITYKNFIVGETVTGTQKRPVNTDSAGGYGVEAQTKLDYEVWTFKGAYSYLKAEDNSKKPLPLSPENQYQASVGMRWAFLYGEVTETIWDRFYDRSGSNVIALNSWDTTDFTLETINLNNWTVKVSALNIFDRPVELTEGYPEVQRRFLLSVERSF